MAVLQSRPHGAAHLVVGMRGIALSVQQQPSGAVMAATMSTCPRVPNRCESRSVRRAATPRGWRRWCAPVPLRRHVGQAPGCGRRVARCRSPARCLTVDVNAPALIGSAPETNHRYAGGPATSRPMVVSRSHRAQSWAPQPLNTQSTAAPTRRRWNERRPDIAHPRVVKR